MPYSHPADGAPVNQRRWQNFRANKRGLWSLRIFLVLFFVSLFSELIANDKPIIASYQDKLFFPILARYPETDFGGEFESEADYRDEYVAELINNNGWMIWPLIRYSYDTINYDLTSPAPLLSRWPESIGHR